MMKHLVLVNFKAYKEGTGKKALKLAKIIASFKSSRYQLAIAPQIADLKEICQKTKLQVFAQHIDNISFGAHTGGVLPEAIKEAGAKGTLLNHSEKKIGLKQIKETVEICKKLKLISVVCAGSLRSVKKIAKLGADYIAYEPKKLIGKEKAVTEVNPKVIVKAVEAVKRINPKIKLLCGAGVHSRKDLEKALELGAEGVLVAHKVVRAKEKGKVLKGLVG